MKRISLGLAVLVCSVSLFACSGGGGTGGGTDGGNGGGGTTTDGGNGGGTTTDGGTTADGGSGQLAGTVTVTSSGNALPAAMKVADASVLKVDGSGTGAMALQDFLVTLNVPTTYDSAAPCAVPYKTYCDSFNVKDGSGNEVAINYYSFLGNHPGCTTTIPPAAGTQFTAITGLWQANYDSTTKTTAYAIAPVDCGGLDSGAMPTGGGTGQAPMTSDIAQLKAAGLQDGPVHGIRGVVVATWSASSAWGFTMEDTVAQGGSTQPAGIQVEYNSKYSTSTATAPKVGDAVTVSGTVSAVADKINL